MAPVSVWGERMPFPVVDASPTLGKVVGNFYGEDYGKISAGVGLSVPFAHWIYMKTFPHGAVRSAVCALTIGALAGFSLAVQGSHARLTGLSENKAEQERHAAL